MQKRSVTITEQDILDYTGLDKIDTVVWVSNKEQRKIVVHGRVES